MWLKSVTQREISSQRWINHSIDGNSWRHIEFVTNFHTKARHGRALQTAESQFTDITLTKFRIRSSCDWTIKLEFNEWLIKPNWYDTSVLPILIVGDSVILWMYLSTKFLKNCEVVLLVREVRTLTHIYCMFTFMKFTEIPLYFTVHCPSTIRYAK